MWATSEGPRVEDFGITEDDLEHAPRPFLAHHRLQVLAGAYVIAAGLLFSTIFAASDSMPAAAFFTVIALAAGSVLLLPVLVFALCAGEQAEERWLCRRVPILTACLAYQRALADHRRNISGCRIPSTPPAEWFGVGQTAFVELVGSELDRRGGVRVSAADREATGFDFIVEHGRNCVLLRCEAGLTSIGAAVGRELAAAVNDFGADEAVIVTVSEPTAVLDDYIADRPITLAAPWELDKVLSEYEQPYLD
jgi:hypothetical protein